MIGAEWAERLGAVISCHPGFQILLGVVRDSNIIRLYKGHLAMNPSDPGPCWFPRLKMLSLPAWLFLKHLRNGWIRQPKASAKAAIPCLWGVPEPGSGLEIAGVRRFTDDMYLYGEHFKPGEVVHIFGDWHIPDAGKREWREAMEARGILHTDRHGFGANWNLLRLTIRATWAVLIRCVFRSGWQGNFSPEIWRASIKGLYHYLLKHYEMENVKYVAEVVKNDYNPGHVAATIAANQAGRKRIGVSHVSSAVDSPQICFVHFDKYATVCPMQEKWHGRFWDGVPIERVGGLSIDSAVDCHKRRSNISARINARYGTFRKHTVLILFPGDADRCFAAQWEKMHGALTEFSRTDIDARVFLRFRRLTEALKVPHMARIARLSEIDSRFALQHDEFTTHELMAASDLVIAANASFAINEALVIGKPVFTFDYTLKARQYLDMYDPDIVLAEPEDVMRILRDIDYLDGSAAKFERIRKDSDYHFDGRNRERLARLVSQIEMVL